MDRPLHLATDDAIAESELALRIDPRIPRRHCGTSRRGGRELLLHAGMPQLRIRHRHRRLAVRRRLPEAVQGRLLIQDIMDFWLGLGADGFRVDMAGSLVKEDPDHYWTKLLWQQVRAHLDETYPEAVLVSEWGDPEEALHAGFDMDFLLHFGPSHYLDLFRENPYFRPDLPKLRAAPKLPKRNTTANTANAMARAAAGATATAIQSSTETIQIAITTMSAMRAATSRRLWTHIRPCLPAPPERLDTSAFRRAITT